MTEGNVRGYVMKKKIAICANAAMVGGVEETLVQLLRNIDYSRFSVVLYGQIMDLYANRIPKDVEIKDAGVSKTDTIRYLWKHHRMLDMIRYIWLLIVCKICYLHKKKDAQAYYSMRAHRYLPMLSEEEYDLVIAYTYLVSSVVGNAAFRLSGKKKILWAHGDGGHSKNACKKIDTNVYSRFNCVFGCSDAVRDTYVEKYPRSGVNAQTFYNIADTDRILRLAEEPVLMEKKGHTIVTVARLSKEKKQTIIPKAVRILLDAGYDVYWYLVGEGDLRQEIEKEIVQYNVKNNVFLLGTQENPYPYMKNADIYVQTSIIEGYCTTTVEAKILHRPIVTTNAPGMLEQFISGENGLIVNAMTSEAIAEGIRQLLDHPELMKKFTDALKKENYDQAKELKKLYNLIES